MNNRDYKLLRGSKIDFKKRRKPLVQIIYVLIAFVPKVI